MEAFESFTLYSSIALSAATWGPWFRNSAKVNPLVLSPRLRFGLFLVPLLCLLLLLVVLLTLAAKDVRRDPAYLALYLLLGSAWFGVAARLFAFLGISAADDVLERNNPAAFLTISGALLGTTASFAGANIGNGPGVEVVLFSALLSTLIFLAGWLAVERLTSLSEAITVDRNLAAGIRLAGFLVPLGLLSGWSVAGDWSNYLATLRDAFTSLPPTILLCVLFLSLEFLLRRKRFSASKEATISKSEGLVSPRCHVRLGGFSRSPFVNPPWVFADPLPLPAWSNVREQAIFDCCKWDIQSEDHSVLANFPLLLEEHAWQDIAAHAEHLAAETLAAEAELAARPDLHRELGLPRSIRRVLAAAAFGQRPVGAARVMRFDFHFTSQGWRISEGNTDVPGGFIESSGFAQLMSQHYPACRVPPGPTEIYVDAIHRAAGDLAAIGLVHATAYTDDRQVMQYLAKALAQRGLHPVLLSPAHLSWKNGRAQVRSSDTLLPRVLIRFFPAEWLPNLSSAADWKPWFVDGQTPMSNPATALLTQSKRFPLTWPDLRTALPTWKTLLPQSLSPREVPNASTDDWVFKPIFGRVGEDILMPGVSDSVAQQKLHREIARRPEDWVAQRRFDSVPAESPVGARHACLGVFTVDSRAAGIYGRISAKPLIDQDAQDIAVLIRPQEVSDALR